MKLSNVIADVCHVLYKVRITIQKLVRARGDHRALETAVRFADSVQHPLHWVRHHGRCRTLSIWGRQGQSYLFQMFVLSLCVCVCERASEVKVRYFKWENKEKYYQIQLKLNISVI